jgi:sucrose-6F-phosphate phosphohydrolase
VLLAYVTGRHRKLVEQAIEEFSLPEPSFVIGDVGTSIYDVVGDRWNAWNSWQVVLARQWDSETRDRMRSLLADLQNLRQQERSKQGTFKLSYYTPPEPASKPLVEAVQQRLAESGLPARLIFSRDEQGGGLLDVVPAAAGKLGAIEFLIRQCSIRCQRTVFAGDSGNDLEVLVSEIPAVLVANASEAVRQEAREKASARGHADRLYLAHGTFKGLNGNYSAGILEGVAHFLPETMQWIE